MSLQESAIDAEDVTEDYFLKDLQSASDVENVETEQGPSEPSES